MIEGAGRIFDKSYNVGSLDVKNVEEGFIRIFITII